MADNLKSEEKQVDQKLSRNGSEDDATFSQQTDRLPEGAVVNADGVPTYMGLSGNKLIWASASPVSFPPSATPLTCRCSPQLRVSYANVSGKSYFEFISDSGYFQ